MKIAILGLSGSENPPPKQLGSFITLRSCIWTLCTFCPAGWSAFRRGKSSWSPRFLTPTAAGSWTETTPKPVMPGGWKRQTRSSSLLSTAFFASGGSSGGGGPTGALCGIPPRPAVWKKIDAEFVWWVLYQGRTPARIAGYRQIARQYPEKFILIQNPRQLARFLSSGSYSQ